MQENRKPDVTYYKSTQTSTTANSQTAVSDSISASISTPAATTAPDEQLIFIITVENTSSTAIEGIEIKERLKDSFMTYIEKSAIYYKNDCPKPAKYCNREEEDLFFIDEDLLPHEKLYMSFMAKTFCENLPSSIYNYAVIKSDKLKSEIATNSIKIDAEYAIITAEKLISTDKFEDIYTIKLTNNGNLKACDITITDTVKNGYKVKTIAYDGHYLIENTDYFSCATDYIIKLPCEIEPTKTIEITVTEIKK